MIATRSRLLLALVAGALATPVLADEVQVAVAATAVFKASHVILGVPA